MKALFICPIKKKMIVSKNSSNHPKMWNFRKTRPVEFSQFHTDGWTEWDWQSLSATAWRINQRTVQSISHKTKGRYNPFHTKPKDGTIHFTQNKRTVQSFHTKPKDGTIHFTQNKRTVQSISHKTKGRYNPFHTKPSNSHSSHFHLRRTSEKWVVFIFATLHSQRFLSYERNAGSSKTLHYQTCQLGHACHRFTFPCLKYALASYT